MEKRGGETTKIGTGNYGFVLPFDFSGSKIVLSEHVGSEKEDGNFRGRGGRRRGLGEAFVISPKNEKRKDQMKGKRKESEGIHH